MIKVLTLLCILIIAALAVFGFLLYKFYEEFNVNKDISMAFEKCVIETFEDVNKQFNKFHRDITELEKKCKKSKLCKDCEKVENCITDKNAEACSEFKKKKKSKAQ